MAPTATLGQTREDPEVTSGLSAKLLALAENHMIATAHATASETGREMLRAGRSATNAAVAALLALNVVERHRRRRLRLVARA